MESLQGKVALVTGAGRGIGRAIALRLAGDGADIVVAEMDMPAAEDVAAEVRALGQRALTVRADVAEKAQVQAMVARTIAELGRIDILVNNAGIIGPRTSVVDTPEAAWDRTQAVHTKGTFLCCQAVVPHMVRQGWGRIISMASVAGKEGNPNYAAYSVSKAGVICLTKSLAKEVARQNITVNCIAPSVVDTDLIKGFDPESMKPFLERIPVGRAARPEEIAGLARFLASDEAAFITGQCCDISGGYAVY